MQRSFARLLAPVPGILVTDPNTCHLQERDDVDTLLNEGRVAGEFYGGRFPRTLGWVVVDDEQHLRCLVYEATITAIDNEHAQQTAKAAWIVYLALGAPFKFAEGGDPEAVREAERGWDSLAGEWDYPKFLNAFEVMARHNAAGVLSSINHVGIRVFQEWLPGLIRAYDTYRSRALAGAYQPVQHADDEGSS